MDDLIKGISAFLPGIKFIPNETVIIFDEIQECSNARSSIKSFMVDGRFDIIATGSLIGLSGYNKKLSRGIPTGFEKSIIMKPMDFEEYLWAIGISNSIIHDLKESFNKKKSINENINNAMFKHFKDYLCIGGMPEAVNIFIKTHDMNRVYEVLQGILMNYQDDFVTTFNYELTVIEVKSTNSKSKSLKNVISNNIGNYKLIDGNIGESNGINTIPLYLAYLIHE